MNLDFLLQHPALTAIKFADESGTSAPRAIIPIAVDNAAQTVKVIEQGIFLVKQVEYPVMDFLKMSWPDSTTSRSDAAKRIAQAARGWLPCKPEHWAALGKLIVKEDRTMKRQAKSSVAVEPTKPAETSTLPRAVTDSFRRTAIELSRDERYVHYLPMSEGFAFDLTKDEIQRFDQRYKPMVDYPVERAAQLFISYACVSGATKAAMKALSGITPVSEKEHEMAVKKGAETAPAKKTKAKKAAVADKRVATAKKVVAAKKTDNGATRAVTPRGESAAAMFQELIRESKLTDDAIFAKVQAKFSLDSNKRGYVGWYRNYLKKKGEDYPVVASK